MASPLLGALPLALEPSESESLSLSEPEPLPLPELLEPDLLEEELDLLPDSLPDSLWLEDASSSSSLLGAAQNLLPAWAIVPRGGPPRGLRGWGARSSAGRALPLAVGAGVKEGGGRDRGKLVPGWARAEGGWAGRGKGARRHRRRC